MSRDAVLATSDIIALLLMARVVILHNDLLTVMHLDRNENVPEKYRVPLQHRSPPGRLERNCRLASPLSHYSPQRASQLNKRACRCDYHIGAWASDLSKFVLEKYSGTVPLSERVKPSKCSPSPHGEE